MWAPAIVYGFGVYWPAAGPRPVELTALGRRTDELESHDCAAVWIGTEPGEVHRRWLATPIARGGLGALPFPRASDSAAEVARRYGVFDEGSGTPLHALFLVDPDGVIQFERVSGRCLGRSLGDPWELLDAIRGGGDCPRRLRLAARARPRVAGPTAGQVLGHYRVLERVGEGAFADVFRAHDLRLEREVAIKVLRSADRLDSESVLHEARASAALDHPNICRVYAVEELDGRPRIVMEWIAGQTLAEKLQRALPSTAESLALARAIVSALVTCHDAGVVHGDLKPGNVMYTGAGVPKVLDFGIAARDGRQVLPTSSTASMVITAGDTREGAPSVVVPPGLPGADRPPGHCRETVAEPRIAGTPAYMAPELLEGDPTSPPSDVYAFGAQLFEMTTGAVPYPGRGFASVLRRIHATPPDQVVRRAPAPLWPLLERTLCLHPGARSTAGELLELLEVSVRGLRA